MPPPTGRKGTPLFQNRTPFLPQSLMAQTHSIINPLAAAHTTHRAPKTLAPPRARIPWHGGSRRGQRESQGISASFQSSPTTKLNSTLHVEIRQSKSDRHRDARGEAGFSGRGDKEGRQSGALAQRLGSEARRAAALLLLLAYRHRA